MADLTGQTPASTYKGLLQVNDYTNGVDATAKYIQDGEGTNSALAVSTANIGIGTDSPDFKLTVDNGIGNEGLKVIAGNNGDSNESVFEAWNNKVNGSDPELLFKIRGDGNVGVGTVSSPAATLQIDAQDSSTNALAFWVRNVARTNSIISAYENGNVRLGSFSYDDASGNLGLGNVTTFGTNATSTIAIKEGVEPTSSPGNLVQLFCAEVSGSAELRVRDEAGNVTTLSPHAKDAPSSLYDRPPGAEEMHRSANHYLGSITFTNVDRRNALMQKQLNGEELPEDRTFTITETFAEYNARTGADLQVEDWDANQQAMFDEQEEKVLARQAEIDAWDDAEKEAPEPLQSYVKKPKPEWLS